MSIAQNFPTIAPSLSLDFASVQALDPRITFARATTATYYGTRTALAEQNLMTSSNSFGTATTGATLVTNNATSPDGTNTAVNLTVDTSTGGHYVQTTIAPMTTGLIYTFSIFVKPNTVSTFGMREAGFGASNAQYNLSTVSVTSSSGCTTSITAVNDGWLRIAYTITAPFTGNLSMQLGPQGYTSFTGNGTDSVYMWGMQLEQRSTVTAYTPTTTQPITNYIPVLETAASGVARFDHNPVTFESLGLLIEQQSTNLVTYSEDFDNAAWSKGNATITANTIVAPDGTLTADKLVENTATGQHFVSLSPVTTLNASYSLSIFAKAGERTRITLFAFGSTTVTVTFDLSAGTVASGTGTIQSVGNGWYRCVLPYLGATSTTNQGVFLVSSGTTTSYTGDGYSGVFIWGAQLEALAFPTSYIKTEASQVTRAVDSALITGANFSSWYNAGQGTLYSEVFDSGLNPWAVSVSINDKFYFRQTGSTAFGVVMGSGGSAFTTTLPAKIAATYNGGTTSSSANGLTAQTTSGLTPINAATILHIGNYNGGAFVQNGRIKKISYYPIAFTNTNLQALTG
jgi:hypothetical protein